MTQATRKPNCGRIRRALLPMALMLFACPAASHAQGDSAAAPAALPAGDSLSAPAGKPGDALFGNDKPRHFLIAGFLESVTFASLEAVGVTRAGSLATATVVAAGFSVARELHDRRTKGVFGKGDLFWDAVGIAASMVLLRHTY